VIRERKAGNNEPPAACPPKNAILATAARANARKMSGEDMCCSPIAKDAVCAEALYARPAQTAPFARDARKTRCMLLLPRLSNPIYQHPPQRYPRPNPHHHLPRNPSLLRQRVLPHPRPRRGTQSQRHIREAYPDQRGGGWTGQEQEGEDGGG